ncbi:hypothetical protein [Pseudoalteromonas viridis]|uniref:Uncharacterized protein n=1 Tax=Pseudoalteromonas viridis TaxID=339617 RepID=A0ABX7VBT9_9GAMM|nr:hypothetical protein [Pseudoalteromonas viridis]QTL37995.1 hypothetical protein J5X90_19840 [Pseudoalteromonas viridis]
MSRVAPETWYAVGFFFLLILGPFTIGWGVMKAYRHYFPKTPPTEGESSVSVVSQLSAQRDGFFKLYLLGLVICSPGFYYIYTEYLAHI